MGQAEGVVSRDCYGNDVVETERYLKAVTVSSKYACTCTCSWIECCLSHLSLSPLFLPLSPLSLLSPSLSPPLSLLSPQELKAKLSAEEKKVEELVEFGNTLLESVGKGTPVETEVDTTLTDSETRW